MYRDPRQDVQFNNYMTTRQKETQNGIAFTIEPSSQKSNKHLKKLSQVTIKVNQ